MFILFARLLVQMCVSFRKFPHSEKTFVNLNCLPYHPNFIQATENNFSSNHKKGACDTKRFFVVEDILKNHKNISLISLSLQLTVYSKNIKVRGKQLLKLRLEVKLFN